MHKHTLVSEKGARGRRRETANLDMRQWMEKAEEQRWGERKDGTKSKDKLMVKSSRWQICPLCIYFD